MTIASIPTLGRQLDRTAFFESIGYKPHAGQLLIHNSEASRRILSCGVRWGKSLCAAMEALAAAMEPAEHSVGWVCAPSYTLADKVFREIHRIIGEKLPHRILGVPRLHDMDLRIINLSGGISEIRGKTADNPVNLLGEGLDWLIVDEASRVKPEVWQSYLSQRLVDRQGWAMFISTPKGKGWFYDMFRRGQKGTLQYQPEYESWNSPSWENPLLKRDFIEQEKLRLPESVWRQEYGAEFIEGEGSVFRNVRECATVERWFEPGRNDFELVDAGGILVRMQEKSGPRSFYAGLDLAKVNDYTVLTVVDDLSRVAFVDRFRRMDWALQGQRLKAALDRYGNPAVLVDTTGSGEPVYEALLALGINAQPYPFTNATKNALVNNLALMLEQRKLALPSPELFPELVDELELYQFSITELGNLKSGAPLGYFDDCVMSAALACMQLANRAYFVEESQEGW